MVATIADKKINTVISSYQQTNKTLIEGSDEHLDLILDINVDLKQITKLTKELVDEIEKQFNALTKDTAKEAVDKILPCLKLADQIINTLTKSSIYPSVKNNIDKFKTEVLELKEFINDLLRYKIQDNAELIVLLDSEK